MKAFGKQQSSKITARESVNSSQKTRFFGISETRFFQKTGFLGSSARKNLWRILGSWIMAQGVLLGNPAVADTVEKPMSYSQLLQKIDAGEVEEIDAYPSQNIAKVRLLKETESIYRVNLFEYHPELLEKSRAKNIDYEVKNAPDNSLAMGLVLNLLVILAVIVVLLMLLRRTSQAQGNALNFGKSRARFQMEAKTGILFDDVAGIEGS